MTVEDYRALTPLGYGHVNPYGLFQLDLDQRLRIPLSQIRQPNGKNVKIARFEHNLLALLEPCQTTIKIMSFCGSVQLR